MERKIKVSKIKKVLLEAQECYEDFTNNWSDEAIEQVAEELKIKLTD